MPARTVHLFPGLGAYSTGALRQARADHPEVTATFRVLDDVAVARGLPEVSGALFGAHAPSLGELLEQPAEVLQLAIFGVSVATHEVLLRLGGEPDLLLGHSFGEMAALVAAGAFDLADGAQLVCARCAALRDWEGRGMMAAIGTHEAAARHLAGLLDEPGLVVGCHNAPRQSVLSGPVPAIDRAERVAGALELPYARLQLPYASHHPAMRPAVPVFRELMDGVRQRQLRLPVYSPIHHRHYTDEDDLKQELAECLVLPVDFVRAARDLHARGYTRFVEAGALNALTRCVELTVPGVEVAAPLVDPDRELAGLHAAAGVAPERSPQVPRPRDPRPADGAATVVAPAAGPEPAEPVRQADTVSPEPPEQARANGHPPRETVLAELRQMYAEALEYPTDVLTADAMLEAELGVDSLKQTSLLSRVVDRFGMTGERDRVRVWELPTLGHIADYVAERSGRREAVS
ncbi:acyltransferase domain-containing protein [Amycolatopsis aidingensis]|uniref:acyltransferase domain-containing protein n=1 Tax=Amycolatopsis aidingensis TaxID=2842453 RepID=UPI001C0CFA56|nr:acyltransferase domain-containing protein [Amycolatopsis aidingensis]